MDLTPKLKAWVAANRDLDKDAPDQEYKEACADALADGSLTTEKFVELSAPDKAGEAGVFEKKLDAVAGGLNKLVDLLTAEKTAAGKKKKDDKKEEMFGEDDEEEEDEEDDDEEKEEKKSTGKAGGKERGRKDAGATEKGGTPAGKNAPPTMLAKMVARFGGLGGDDDGNKTVEIRVKEAAEAYDDTKTALTYPALTKAGKPYRLAGQPVQDMGRALNVPSDRDKAVAGAFAKYLAAKAQRGGSRTFGFQALPQHDRELLLWSMNNQDWVGSSEGGNYEDIKGRLTPNQQKALIDDATSGGLEAAPIVFDDQVIQTPLLHGELFPLVNTVPLDRGRRVEGVSTGTVTSSWGGVDDTAIALFNTASYVSAFDTTIFRWEGAIRIGLDFLSDTPIDFGQHVTAQYGERLLEDLDDIIATGNGTTQPEGVMTKSGTTSVAFGGATSIGNYESLLFGINKAERRPNLASSIVFCGNETSYERARALPVGASDARRLGGTMATMGGTTDYLNYMWMGHPYKINESLASTQIFYAVLARYRMYRRRGLTMRSSTEGDTLIRANEMLLVATARYGGQLERGACAAVTSDAPA